MITKDELTKRRRQLDAKKRADDNANRKAMDDFAAKQFAENCERARGLVKGELGELIQRADDKKLKRIRISEYRNEARDNDDWDDMYDDFRLGFDPKKEEKYSQILARSLRRAGFLVQFSEVEVDNVRFEPNADGYSIEPAPGTHTEYYLEISWD